MKKNILILTLTLLLTFSASVLYATETSGSASVDVMSNYVWRGQKLSNGTVVQPSVGITYGGFGANLWANYDTGPNEHNETDLTLNYTFLIDKFSLDAGYIFYTLDGAEDTQEVYLAFGIDTLLNPALTVYYDFDEGDGAFIVASIGHSFALPQNLAINLGASASYNVENLIMGTDTNGEEFNDFYNGEVAVSISIPVTDAISVEPKAAYSFPLSNDSEDALMAISDDADDEIFYGGINVTLSF
jgi:hypothetical protein